MSEGIPQEGGDKKPESLPKPETPESLLAQMLRLAPIAEKLNLCFNPEAINPVKNK